MHPASNLTAFFILSIFLLAGMIETTAGQVNYTEQDLDVICMETSMHIVLKESVLEEHQLRIANSNCTLFSNGTHLLANMSLDECGTEMEDDGEYLIFSNAIVSYNDTSAVIVRHPLVDIEFSCKYPKRSNLTIEFNGHRPPISFTQKGFGKFTLQFEFFKSEFYSQAEDPESFPLEFDLGEMMYMQINSISFIPNTKLRALDCTAAPTDLPADQRKYQILKNGCEVDETVQIYTNGNDLKVQFAMEAFKFIGLYDQVFITCSTILCKAGIAGSTCSQICPALRPRREAPSLTDDNFIPTEENESEHSLLPVGQVTHFTELQRSKRDAPLETSRHFISQGPVRIRPQRAIASVPDQVAQNLDPNLEMFFGAFLVAVAMVCGVVIYRTRKATYQRMV
ncbi:ZP domain-containing protein-like isoform X2 [Alosa alosa]|uniref:ZP domain-containing protein-like isoform X1 n=1 Tax=Alosa alosa TaxID=278164 RepID=UPI0020151ED0|nr:ZP domain-containing protein-like isoform X1 [Alosa alosa]XP_048094324.1 ZP domain-containing protein-like isoform X2 [Alosa alosa]